MDMNWFLGVTILAVGALFAVVAVELQVREWVQRWRDRKRENR